LIIPEPLTTAAKTKSPGISPSYQILLQSEGERPFSLHTKWDVSPHAICLGTYLASTLFHHLVLIVCLRRHRDRSGAEALFFPVSKQ
jgi:hypothetical protein